jgi:hypothetical protein
MHSHILTGDLYISLVPLASRSEHHYYIVLSRKTWLLHHIRLIMQKLLLFKH